MIPFTLSQNTPQNVRVVYRYVLDYLAYKCVVFACACRLVYQPSMPRILPLSPRCPAQKRNNQNTDNTHQQGYVSPGLSARLKEP